MRMGPGKNLWRLQWWLQTFRLGQGGGGGSHPDPEIRGGPKNNFVSAQRASVWSKNKPNPKDPSITPVT